MFSATSCLQNYRFLLLRYIEASIQVLPRKPSTYRNVGHSVTTLSDNEESAFGLHAVSHLSL
jgi:hypothetical protein